MALPHIALMLLLAGAPPLQDLGSLGAALAAPEEMRGDDEALLDRWRSLLETEPASPAAEIVLRRLSLEAGRFASLGTLRPALERILGAAPGSVPGPSRVLARSLLAGIAQQEGRMDDVRALAAADGTIRQWLILGPFGEGMDVDHETRFDAESDIEAPTFDIGRVFDGSRRPARWRRVEMLPEEADLVTGSLVAPDPGAVIACAQFQTEAPAEGVLVVSCRMAWKLWLDGRLAADADRNQEEYADPAAIPIHLEAGWHRIAVKVIRGGAIRVMLLTPDGRALPATFETERACREVRRSSSEASPPILWGAGEAVLAAASGETEDASLLLARAFLRAAWGLQSQAVADARRLAEIAGDGGPEAGALVFRAAQIIAGASYLPDNVVRSEARGLQERALACDPGNVWAAREVAVQQAQDDQVEDAVRRLREAVTRAPRNVPLILTLARMLLDKSWIVEARSTLGEAQAVEPDDPRVIAFEAEIWQRLGNAARREECWRRAYEIDRSLTWIPVALADLAAARGDLAHAIQERERLLQANRSRTSDLYILADLYARQGDLAQANACLDRLAARRPFDPEIPRRRAEMLLGAGDTEGAKTALRRVLDVQPGDPRARELLRSLDAAAGDDPTPRYGVGLADVLQAIPPRERYPDASAVCLLDETVVRVFPDGSSEHRVHQVHLILDAGAIQEFHSLSLPGDVLEARTLVRSTTPPAPIPPGTILSSAVPGWQVLEPVRGTGTSEILLPGLAPGAVVEYSYRANAGGSPDGVRLGQFYFRDHSFQQPLHRTRYIVISPPDLRLEAIARNLGTDVRFEERRDGPFRVWIWEGREMDRIPPDAGLPPRDDLLPWVEVRSPRTWDEVRAELRDPVLATAVVTEDIRRAAAEATAGVEGDTARIQAIARYVAERVTEPSGGMTASQVLAERGGSRTIALVALLRAAGIRAHYARATPPPELTADPLFDYPSAESFTIPLILCEPSDGEPIWLVPDGPRLMPAGRILEAVQGGVAIVTDAQGGRFEVVPREGPAENSLVMRFDLALQGNDARLAGRIEALQAGAWEDKEQIQNLQPAQVRAGIGQMVNSLFRGAVVEDLTFPGLRESALPLAFEFRGRVPRYVTTVEGRPGIPIGIAPMQMTRSFVGRPERQVPYHFALNRFQRDRMALDLGAGWTVAEVPPDLFIRHEIGTYSLSFALERTPSGERLVVERAVSFQATRLPPERFASFIELCRRIDDAERGRIILAPAN